MQCAGVVSGQGRGASTGRCVWEGPTHGGALGGTRRSCIARCDWLILRYLGVWPARAPGNLVCLAVMLARLLIIRGNLIRSDGS